MKFLMAEGIKKRINEEIDRNIDNAVKQLAILTEKINDIKKVLKSMEKEYEEFLDVVLPVVEATEDQFIKTKEYVFTIVKKGYERETPKYKEAFLEALTKVNANTKKILEQVLDGTKGISKVKPKFSITHREGVGDFYNKIILKVKHIVSSLLRNIRNIKDGNKVLEYLAKKK